MNRQPAKRIFKSEDEMIQSVRGASAVGSTLMIGNADSTGSTVKALLEWSISTVSFDGIPSSILSGRPRTATR